MDRDRLVQALKPPLSPVEVPSEENWLAVERTFCELPEDFKTFIAQYGTGSIDGFIWLFNPASRNEHLNLLSQMERQLKALHASQLPELTLFPSSDGILPFGITDNGDVLAWRVRGHANQWQVVVVDSRAPLSQEFEMGLAQFLLGILSKNLVCTIFPDDFPSPSPVFESI